ncbi:MAG: AAA family ATPase [Roseibium sp.]|uniref:AAA family ATPase n=1 Tax=Roseibium sp. TaxID=1936156 RepID=UPI00329860A7
MNSPDDFEDAGPLPEIVICLMADADQVASGFGTSTGLSHFFMAYCASAGGSRRIRGMGADPVSMRDNIAKVLKEATDDGNYVGSDGPMMRFMDRCRDRFNDLCFNPEDTAMMDSYPNGILLSIIARTSGSCAVTEAVMSAGGLAHLLPQLEDYDHVEEELDMLLEREFPGDGPIPEVSGPVESTPDHAGAESLRGLWEGVPGVRKPGYGPEEGKPAPENLKPARPPRPAAAKKEGPGSHLADNPVEALERAIRRLSDMAENGEIDPVHGRDAEIDHITSVIMRRKKSSIILHGDAGVGKTSIVEGLAMALRRPDADPDLAKRPLYEISLSGLVAGSRFRGDFEGRIAEMIRRAGEENAILFIDEIHNIVGSGASGSRSNDGANMLKPALARGDITIIGATTSREARVMRSDHALMRRFDMLHIREPSPTETREILRRSAWGYTAHHKIMTTSESLDEIVRICAEYMTDRKFPDKAFDLLDMGSVVAREREADALKPEHVREAAVRIGVRLPGPPPEVLRKALLRLDDDLTLPGETREAIGRAARAAWMRGDRRGVMAAWGLVAESASLSLRLAQEFSEIMDLPLRTIDLSGVRDMSNVGALVGYPGRNEATDPPGDLIEIGDGAPETVILFQGVDSCHPAAMRMISEMCATGSVQSADGRLVNMGGAWALFDIRPDGTSRIGFGDGGEDDLSHVTLKALGESMSHALTGSWKIDAEEASGEHAPELDAIISGLSLYGIKVACADDLRARILAPAPAAGADRDVFFARLRETLCDQALRFSLSGSVEMSLRHDEVVLVPA